MSCDHGDEVLRASVFWDVTCLTCRPQDTDPQGPERLRPRRFCQGRSAPRSGNTRVRWGHGSPSEPECIGGFTAATSKRSTSHFHRKGSVYTSHLGVPQTAYSQWLTCRGPHTQSPAQQSRSPSLAARRWRWTLSCCSSSWFGCQSFMMTLSMLSAYTVCVGMTSLCTCGENVSTPRDASGHVCNTQKVNETRERHTDLETKPGHTEPQSS